jgi:hypothetical protein
MELQKTKAQDLDKLLKSTAEQLEAAFAKNDFATIEALAKKVNGQIFKDTEVNQFDQTLATTSLSPQEADQIFKAQPGSTLNFGNPGSIFLVKVIGKKSGIEKTPDQMKAEFSSQNQMFSRKVREELIKTLNNKAKVVTNQNLL